jgi:3-oxoacyl-[acyl-carrier protein] reductase
MNADPGVGRAVLVTGASRGIGAAVAAAFAERGDRVAVQYGRSRERAEEVVARLPGEGHLLVQAELTNAEAVRRMVDEAAAGLAGIDVLVNNAGIFTPHPITATTYDEWQEGWRATIDTNLVAAANVTWCAVQHMVAADRGGRVINIASRGAFRGEAEQPAYGASKAGMIAFGQSLAKALGSYGISVMSVAPGFVETDMVAETLASDRGDALRSESPFGRVATPEDVAAVVVFLASPEAGFTSGTVVDVNGASYLRM